MSTTPLLGGESPEAAISQLFAALGDGDWEATAPLVFDDQLALLASIEGITPPETAAMLREGVPDPVRANFWEGFVEGFPLFAREEVAELLIGEVERRTVDGVQFGAVLTNFRYGGGEAVLVTRETNGRWRLDLMATFGPAFANPLREWLESLEADDHADTIRAAMAEQEASFNSALEYEPLGDVSTVLKFEIRLLMVEANS